MTLKILLVITPLLCWHGVVTAGTRPCPSMAAPGASRLIKTTCDQVAQRLTGVPGATVRTAAQAFVDGRSACTRQGCVVTLDGSFRVLKDQASPDSWLGEYLEVRGWSRTLSHDADGPDGTIYALHRPGALCIVEGKWNHWHDDGGESHTDDAYEVTVSCGAAQRKPPGSHE